MISFHHNDFSRTVRYELRVLVGFKRAHRGWSKVYTAPAALRPPLQKARNYNGFSASVAKSMQKPKVFLRAPGPHFKKAMNYIGFSAPAAKSIRKTRVFLPASVPHFKKARNYIGFRAVIITMKFPFTVRVFCWDNCINFIFVTCPC